MTNNLKVKSIKVEEGDTLWSLAEKHLGNGQRWRDIFNWNVVSMIEKSKVPEKVSPDYIVTGDTIKVLTPDPQFEPSGN